VPHQHISGFDHATNEEYSLAEMLQIDLTGMQTMTALLQPLVDA
jgi:ssRNA-specific RNase YbeY (16S rRNA maturation enzyme)